MNTPLSRPPSVEKALQRFLGSMEQKRQEQYHQKGLEAQIVHKKHLLLVPMRQLLKGLIDMGLVVTNANMFNQSSHLSAKDKQPLMFTVSEGPSSGMWSPGQSLYLVHPAEIEIAVPNEEDQSEQGVVVIRCTSRHSDLGADVLDGPFRSTDEACLALADFLAQHAQHINPAASA